MREHYGFELNISAVRTITLAHAERANVALASREAKTFRSLPAQGAEHVIAEADGTIISTIQPGRPRNAKHPREWKEIRLVAAKAKGRAEARYGAGFLTVEETGRRWGHCTRDAGWGLNTRVHVVADGAEWIRKQSHEAFGDQGFFLLDYFHVSEYLAAAAPAAAGKHTPARWRRIQQKRLLRGAASNVLDDLQKHLEPPAAEDALAPVRAAHRYLSRRTLELDYPTAIRLELPIGSGLIESGHRHVLQHRLKLPGATWLPKNAHNLAQLRVLRANHEWTNLWN